MSKDQFWTRIIYIISLVISLAVAFLILGPRPKGVEGALDVSMLPLVNATINGLTTILLMVGYFLIIRKNRLMHRNVMLTSFGTSSLFLVTYIIYHWFKSGPKLYTGDFVSIYYFILITHIILATIIIPLALFTLYRGWFSQLKRHRKIARITLPIWLYVSVTGVIIYWMLYV
jgi:putative membrane protein|tara:strand:+ start:13862 stop:14380 length:519 start_codon:yes stop_codon:yes gene_type:complete